MLPPLQPPVAVDPRKHGDTPSAVREALRRRLPSTRGLAHAARDDTGVGDYGGVSSVDRVEADVVRFGQEEHLGAQLLRKLHENVELTRRDDGIGAAQISQGLPLRVDGVVAHERDARVF